MYRSIYPAFSTSHLSYTHKPAIAASVGTVETRRKSSVLSARELQRLIRDMVD
jgi:hypothetical protein